MVSKRTPLLLSTLLAAGACCLQPAWDVADAGSSGSGSSGGGSSSGSTTRGSGSSGSTGSGSTTVASTGSTGTAGSSASSATTGSSASTGTTGGASTGGGSSGGSSSGGTPDGGCLADSQCSVGYYCDFTAVTAPTGGFGECLVPGSCVYNCNLSPTLPACSESCQTDADCDPSDQCSAGQCQPLGGCPGAQCVDGCYAANVPHGCPVCVCPQSCQAAICTSDSQCPASGAADVSYCDFTTIPCGQPLDGSEIVAGQCVDVIADPTKCTTDADCLPSEVCGATGTCEVIECPPTPACPGACPFEIVPHACGACICPTLQCCLECG